MAGLPKHLERVEPYAPSFFYVGCGQNQENYFCYRHVRTVTLLTLIN